MRRYRIAVFTVDWNCELVENTMRGLKQFVSDHENVQVCIFDCFGKNETGSRPFELSMSVGIINADSSAEKTLEEYIQEADALMYEKKKKAHGASRRQSV